MFFEILRFFATVTITAVLSALVTAIAGYVSIVRPSQQRARQAREVGIQLVQKQMYEDLSKWIGYECQHYETPGVEAALKQRLAERQNWLEQYQQRLSSEALPPLLEKI
jgi:hypothetical protein